MACSSAIMFQKPTCLSSSSILCRNHNLSLNPSQFLSSRSLLKLKKQCLGPAVQIQLRNHKVPGLPIVYAAQSNIFRGTIVIQTVWKVGKDGIEAGTSLIPDVVPRPVARISVTVVAVTLALFVLKSFLSTVFFAAAVIGLSYFTFLALNKDERPKGGGDATSVDDSLEEARRIMEKYK